MYDIDLAGLPRVNGTAWHSPNFPALWTEVSRRFHAVARHTVWLDTTQAAIEDWRRRHRNVAAAAEAELEEVLS
jgi:hypothetical protein